MSHHGFGSELHFGQRAARSLYADDLPDDAERISVLFNDAMHQIARNDWREAEHTLVQLLELAPDDGEALVMLAKVHVARGRLEYALRALDDALDAGWSVDPQLRRAIADRLDHSDPPPSLFPDPEGYATPSGRIPGVKDAVAARQGAFRARQENGELRAKVASLEKEVRRWIFATMGVCVTATGLITSALVPPIPGSSDPDPALAAVMTPVRRTIQPAKTATHLQAVADRVVPRVSNTLQVDLMGSKAIAAGTLADFREREALERAWLALDDVDRVDWSAVTVTSRIEGGRLQVREGDTLSNIAFRYYGDPTATGPIEDANEVTAEALMPDTFLVIPPLPKE